jgi:hypothetical protein
VVCQYEVSTKVTKEAMKKELEELRAYRAASEYALKSFVDSEARSDFILQHLRNGKAIEEVFESLQQPSSSTADEALALRLLSLSAAGPASGAVDESRSSEIGNVTGQDVNAEQIVVPLVEPWTLVTSDDALVDHLLALYFCWEYPIFASLSKHHFLADFRTKTPRYCSSLLVNAILAVGCIFSRETETIGTIRAIHVTGQQFFSEAERLWAIYRDNVCLTTIQALGLMSIFEASRGRDSQSMFYSEQSIRMAIGMGLHRVVDTPQIPIAELEVRSATIWGAFQIDVLIFHTSYQHSAKKLT